VEDFLSGIIKFKISQYSFNLTETCATICRTNFVTTYLLCVEDGAVKAESFWVRLAFFDVKVLNLFAPFYLTSSGYCHAELEKKRKYDVQ